MLAICTEVLGSFIVGNFVLRKDAFSVVGKIELDDKVIWC